MLQVSLICQLYRIMKRYFIVLFGLLLSLGGMHAQSRIERMKPQWLKVRPVCKNDPSILFVPVTVNLPNENRHEMERRQIYLALPASWRQAVTLSDVQTQTLVDTMENGIAVRKGGATVRSESYMTAEGELIQYRSMLVDEFRVKYPGGEEYSALYQIIPYDGTTFRRCYTYDHYGLTGAALSLVPGVGQFYKGDALKGSLFMGGCVLGGVGAVFTEMQRQAYVSQISQTHDINVIRQLDANQKNIGIARNVCIGLTAALYVWNIFDAAVTPGVKRVKVTNQGLQYNF